MIEIGMGKSICFFLFFLVLRVVFPTTSTSNPAWMMLILETRTIRV